MLKNPFSPPFSSGTCVSYCPTILRVLPIQTVHPECNPCDEASLNYKGSALQINRQISNVNSIIDYASDATECCNNCFNGFFSSGGNVECTDAVFCYDANWNGQCVYNVADSCPAGQQWVSYEHGPFNDTLVTSEVQRNITVVSGPCGRAMYVKA